MKLLYLFLASQTIRADEYKDVDIDHNHKVRVNLSKKDSRVELKEGNDGRKTWNIPDDVMEWDNDQAMCWVSKEAKKKAMPSLRSCYMTTDQACCNFVEDESIGSQYGSLIPSPCHDDFIEIQLFQCIACRGQAVEYTIKAEPTQEYFTNVKTLMKIQGQQTGIERKMHEDIKNDKAKNGYVKVCAKWLKRMWGVESTAALKEVAKPTKMFDSCGAYDFKNGGDAIAKGSKFEAWGDALSFLEWYGIPHMKDFGIIVIDDENPNLYVGLKGDPSHVETCFEGAVKATLAVSAALIGMAYSIY